MAPRAAGDLLTLATVGRRVDDLNLPLQQLYTIGLDERIQGEGCPRLSLAPVAMAAVNEQRTRCHAIAHEAASAAAVEERGFAAHG